MLSKSTSSLSKDLGQFFLRVSSGLLLLCVHGMPKLLNWRTEILHIDDPLHLGNGLTLFCAIFAEVICSIFIILGLYTRLATLPILFLLFVAMIVVHAGWTLEQGQFGWLLIISFGSIALIGPGRYAIDAWRAKLASDKME